MGLRIVDRRLPKRGDISDAERQQGLELAASDWLAARSGGEGGAEFLANFRRVRARLASPGSMVEMATRIRENIMVRTLESTAPHNKVDIATLLELL